jgi:thioredoxin-dependent peroxiredoxin
MSGVSLVFASLGFAVLAAAAASPGPGDDPKPGDLAPAFTLPGSDGKTYTLAEFKGREPVVLAWFPKAFTAG